ncbi:MAG: DUF6502 family protein [Pseudomonadota bacterium]|nr:DUF6502 family protein [Pseudomonadota bacterium]
MDEVKQALSFAVCQLLRPLVRILLRYGIPFGSFMELAKHIYVEIAVEHFALPNRKQTDSRISVLTGLTRKEVKQIRNSSLETVTDTTARYHRAARVISGWIQDRSFLDGWGAPAILSLEGEGPTFSKLVNQYSGDIPVRAILDELLRVNAIERLEDGRLRLIQPAYIPSSSDVDKLAILGTDVALLIETIEHNLFNPTEPAYFQRKVAYDNLPQEAVAQLATMTHEQGHHLLKELNAWLMTQDRDNNPEVSGKGRKYAGVGIYFFEHDVTETDA